MCMAFSKIVTDGRLIHEMEMAASIMLPLMCVAIEIGSSIFSFGKEFQKRRPITHAIDRTHAAVGIRIEMAKNERGLIDSRVELLSEPTQLFVP